MCRPAESRLLVYPVFSRLRCRTDSISEGRKFVDLTRSNYEAMLAKALAEARQGLSEGGIPIGAAIFDARGKLIGAGHNRRVQNGDPSLHGETDAFRNAGRQRSYRKLIM